MAAPGDRPADAPVTARVSEADARNYEQERMEREAESERVSRSGVRMLRMEARWWGASVLAGGRGFVVLFLSFLLVSEEMLNFVE